MPIPRAHRVAGMCLLLLAWGCNTSRYGVNHDQRIQQCRSVAIVPLDVQVFKWRAGGGIEPEPDLIDEIRPRLVEEVGEVIADRERSHVVSNAVLDALHTSERAPDAVPLVAAIQESIHTHHYMHGNARVFDHAVADAVRDLAPDARADAVLCVSLAAAVPTGGRIGLKVTAFVVGGLVGAQTLVKLDEARLVMMLIDTSTGEILWYNEVTKSIDVRSDSSLRRLVRHAGAYVLKPQER